MFIGIHHNITDAKKWEQVGQTIIPMIEQGRLPKGVKALLYLPSTDGRRAVCVWEADSVEYLKRFLEPLTTPAARNEYFQINAEQAMGLPVQVQEHATAR